MSDKQEQFWLATKDGGFIAGPFDRYQYAYNKKKKYKDAVITRQMPKARAGQETQTKAQATHQSYEEHKAALPKCIKPEGAVALVELEGGCDTIHATDDGIKTRCGISPQVHGKFVKFRVEERGNGCTFCGVKEA